MDLALRLLIGAIRTINFGQLIGQLISKAVYYIPGTHLVLLLLEQ